MVCFLLLSCLAVPKTVSNKMFSLLMQTRPLDVPLPLLPVPISFVHSLSPSHLTLSRPSCLLYSSVKKNPPLSAFSIFTFSASFYDQIALSCLYLLSLFSPLLLTSQPMPVPSRTVLSDITEEVATLEALLLKLSFSFSYSPLSVAPSHPCKLILLC